MGTSVKECPAVEGATNHDLVDERPAQVTVTVSASGFSSSMFVNYTHNYSSMSYRSHWEKSFQVGHYGWGQVAIGCLKCSSQSHRPLSGFEVRG